MRVRDVPKAEMKAFIDAVLLYAVKSADYINTSVGQSTIEDEFYYSHYYDRYLLPSFIERYTNGGINKLAIHVARTYDEKWYRLLKAYYEDYDAFKDYATSETYSGREDSGEEESVKTSLTTSTTASQSNKYYGFNSQTAVPVTDSNGTSQETKSGASADNVREKSMGLGKSHTLSVQGNRESPAELFKKEWEARKVTIVDVILTDIASYVCIDVY